MKHFFLSFFCILLANASSAQTPVLYVVSPTPLYLTARTDKPNLGTLLRGARVQVLPGATGDFVKVEVYKGFSGFIASSSIRRALNAADKVSPSPAPVSDRDIHYGSPHLFSLVASLRARDGIGPDAKVTRIYTAGEPVAVYYLPRRADDYAVTGYGGNDGANGAAELVSRQYLGPRPVLSDYLARYDATPAADLAQRRLWAERAMELAWNSGDKVAKAPAMKRFLQVARELKDAGLVASAEISLLLAQAQDNRLPYEQAQPLLDSTRTYGILQGHRIPARNLRHTQVLEWLGKPQQQNKITDDECGVYLGDQMLTYPPATITADLKQNLADVVRLNLQDPKNAYFINRKKVDALTKEADFLRTHGRLIWGSGLHPHEYHLPVTDYGSLIFVFKNGHPVECYWVYQC